MPYCIHKDDFDPTIHEKVGGFHTLEECQQNCGQVGGQAVAQEKEEKRDCGCGGR